MIGNWKTLWEAMLARSGLFLRSARGGYTAEYVVLTAVLVLAVLTIAGIIVAKITGKAISIDFG
jgi:hypothetical protein